MRKIKRRVCVVTGSRAEYGLLYWLMRKIKSDPDMTLRVVVSAAHIERRFGMTYKEITKDGFKTDYTVDMDLSSDEDKAIARSAGMGVAKFGKAYDKIRPDIVVVLGDRFETLAAAFAALLFRIPIAHIHGGEETEGAYDNAIRHAITKMSYLHFTSHERYAGRVVQMGEDPKRVFNFGAPALDNIRKLKLIKPEVLEKDIGFKVDKETAIVTFHPVTMRKGKARQDIGNLLLALKKAGLKAIFTLPNADAENKVIFDGITRYIKENPRTSKLAVSLGQVRYLSLMRYAGLMVGNSSSGIIEAPSFKLPVVNIGDRQKGRIRAKNIIDSKEDAVSIGKAIAKARSASFRKSLEAMRNPLFGNSVCGKIKNVLKTADLANIQKGFYDLR